MITGDDGNAFFELGGAFVVWRNVYQIRKDKQVKGVWWPIWAFYTLWGGWNLWYYPSLGQWHSFIAGVGLFIGNFFWVAHAYYYMVWKRRRAMRDFRLDRGTYEYKVVYKPAACIDPDGNNYEDEPQ